MSFIGNRPSTVPWSIKPLRKRLDDLRRTEHLNSSVWALSDQVLVSAANFGTVVFLGRAASATELGSFTLANTAILVAASWQAAFITQPHNVLGASRKSRYYTAYTFSTLIVQVAMAAAFGVMILAAAYVATVLQLTIAPLLVVAAFAAMAWQLQEFVRRVLYTGLRVSSVLKNDLIAYGGQLLGVALLWRIDRLSASTAMATVAVTSLFGFAVGTWQLRSVLRGVFSRTGLQEVMREHWIFGRWLFGAFTLSWLSEAAYPFLLASFVGVTAVAEMRAGEMIVGPIQVLTFAMGSLFLPRAAAVYHTGGATELKSFMRKLFLLTAPVVIVLLVVLVIFAKMFLYLLYGSRYVHIEWLIVFMAVNAGSNYFRFLVSIPMRAVGATGSLFRAGVWLSASVFIIGVPAIYLYGLKGFAIGLVAGSVVSTTAQWVYYRRVMEEPDGTDSPKQDVALA